MCFSTVYPAIKLEQRVNRFQRKEYRIPAFLYRWGSQPLPASPIHFSCVYRCFSFPELYLVFTLDAFWLYGV